MRIDGNKEMMAREQYPVENIAFYLVRVSRSLTLAGQLGFAMNRSTPSRVCVRFEKLRIIFSQWLNPQTMIFIQARQNHKERSNIVLLVGNEGTRCLVMATGGRDLAGVLSIAQIGCTFKEEKHE